MALSLVLLPVLAPAIGAQPAAGPSPEAKEAMNLGLEAAKEKDWKAAIKHFETVRKTAPFAPPVLFNLAIAHDSINGHEFIAIAFYRAFLTVVPNFKNAEKIRKQISGLEVKIEGIVMKLVDVAEQAARAFPRGTPERNVAIETIASLRAAVGNITSALAIVDSEFRSDFSRNSALYSIGLSQADAGDFIGARKTANWLKNRQGSVSHIYKIIARTQAKAGDIGGALKAAAHIETLKWKEEWQRKSILFNQADAYYEIGYSLIRAGEIQRAKKMVPRIKQVWVSLNPTAKDTNYRYGGLMSNLMSLWIETDLAGAWAYAASIKEDKQRDQAFGVMTRRLVRAGDVGKARQALAEIKNVNPATKEFIDTMEQHQNAVKDATDEEQRRTAEQWVRLSTTPLGTAFTTYYTGLPPLEKEAYRWLTVVPLVSLSWPFDNLKELLRSFEEREPFLRISGIGDKVKLTLSFLRNYRRLVASWQARRQVEATGFPK